MRTRTMIPAAKPVHRDEVATFDSIGGVMIANLARSQETKSQIDDAR